MTVQARIAEPAGHDAPADTDYFIQLNIPREERDEQWELRRDIAQLGGIDAEEGFAFASEYERDHALEILIGRWGPWYFESASARNPHLPRLLIAVSDPDQQVMLGRFFRRHEFSVEVVGDALHALQMLAIHRPQVSIIDTQLMWGGGDGLLSYVQTVPRYRSLRFVVIGDDSNTVSLDGQDSAVAARLASSFQLEELLRAVRAAVNELPKQLHSQVN